jgi:hypothetical protein
VSHENVELVGNAYRDFQKNGDFNEDVISDDFV